ncbi:hypothetical protein Tco_1287197 [Tanacetum coccineum]
MAALKFAETHNLVAFLEKPDESEGFEQIVDFLNAHTIKYALTLQALVDRKKVIITESTIRRDLQLEDADGMDCLPTATIFKELTRIGYENLSQKLTFYKAFFSPQWKYLIHTILQCLSAKTNAWNEFSSTMASRKQKSRKSKKRNTEVPQPSSSTSDVPDENVPTYENLMIV